ncbi:MAG TPA: inorganic phosphate transporter, partial [bacterium]|nr:inorganic phosphate transporter [bacterium]
MWKLFGGLYLGWGIGANDSAKIFAPAIATNTIRFRTAILFICVFVMAGSILQGYTLFDGYSFGGSEKADNDTLLREATIATNAAAFAVMMATIFGIPVSSSQAAVGALVGVAAVRLGWSGIDYAPIKKMGICWVITPVAGALIAYGCYWGLRALLRRFMKSMNAQQRFLRYGIIIIGCYEAFALGANNVVVTTAPFYQAG